MLPEKLYEALPVLYLGAGLTTIWQLEGTLGKISGFLLISAAVLIWYMRYEYRKKLKDRIWNKAQKAKTRPARR